MRANIEDSYGELDPAAARLLRLLGLHPGDGLDGGAAAALAGVPEPRARELLDVLAARGLVTEQDGRFTLPGPVRAFALERAHREDAEADRDAALRRVLDHHLAAGEGELGGEGPALLERERWTEAADVLEERLRLAEREGDRHEILLARHDLARALVRAGGTARAIELLGPLPDEFAALSVPDQAARAAALEDLGEAYLRSGRPVAATNFFGQALEIHRRENAVERQGDVFVRIAAAARDRGDGPAENAALDAAAALYESVLSPKAAELAERRSTR
ncbi:tetratricopeptide repeat protein [Actinomadura sp. GC306]|uniref:tetratricopeptide repeat protein n=1 Tax=Actinomadura sp. GC306 TaxID=2530367 RepID=UPI0010524AB9|nr:tetratricopeptide repeat protein [Actinomadura sp. GC306]TDC64021.1 tetratricopeptide repeat protein [Actinomadura sp. GC306]